MRGLDPRIHLFRKKVFYEDWMDCRVKPGNDRDRVGTLRFAHPTPLPSPPVSV
jgi:hypothetical protein